MVMTKIASRNIAFKAAKMSETAFETQSAIARGVGEAVSLEHESFEDVGRNADWCMYNNEVAQN